MLLQFTRGGPLESVNNRPISVTPTLAKIFGKLLLQRMLEHVEKHKIINKNHFEYLKNKLSNDTVFSLNESIKQLVEQNETVIGIF